MIDKNLIDKDYSFTVTDENGNEMICDTMALIDTGDSPMIIYTDYTLNDDNKFNLFVSKVIQDGDGFSLERVDDISNLPDVKKAMDKIWEENI